ncbi:DUF2138 domain-containing protein [Iodobacter fluviatilis]|uniref:Uncharacterized protein YfaA (DUF2138 family) n=1 Tax=Iodobacter fluviatilis TaxID=537 RepID=A0A377Q857_9NEIS|nr:DUF2138 family protein [Iodobacter fluviatilis]TCU89645.1 uncharacterized protein YfaA (DUF2138 family) [Iodobacter fluviatilis]STQ91017.1 Uncharacterized protein conserved in bacteria [Iodobacter fluviatilis]
MKKIHIKWLLALGSISAAAAVWVFKPSKEIPPKLDTPILALAAGLTPPDLVVATPNLASLPATLMQVPLFKKVLTEDAVDYYEHHPDKLGLEGSLRRIAFEHELNLQDRFMNALLAEPAEMAMWKSDDGRPGHWVLRITKNNFASLLQWVAKASLSDSQLSVDGSIAKVPLYKLQYGHDDAIWFFSQNNKLVVLSDKSWLEGKQAVAWTKILGGLTDDSTNPLLQHYGVQAASSGHAVVANMKYLSFGYQSLFANVKALRLDVSKENGWFSHVLLNQQTKWDGMALWQSAPDGAALCLSAPVDWKTLKPVSKKANIPAEWLAQLEPAAGVCWYPDSSIYTPLLLAQTREPKQFAKQAPKLFDWLIGASEAGLRDEEASRLPVRKSKKDDTLLLQRAVSADDGNLSKDAKDAAPDVSKLTLGRYFDVSMAQNGSSIVFSPDSKLVSTAMTVQQKRYAALADRMEGPKQGYIAPEALSKLLTTATMATLPGKAQPLLQNAAVTYLIPHITAIGEFSNTGLQLSPSADQRKDQHWERLEWKSPK